MNRERGDAIAWLTNRPIAKHVAPCVRRKTSAVMTIFEEAELPISSQYLEVDPERGLRITAAMQSLGLRYNCEVSYDLGVAESTVSRWRHGSPLSLGKAIGLSTRLGVSLDWLLRGLDPDSAVNGLGNDVAACIDCYQHLDTENRQLMVRLVRSLSMKHSGLPVPDIAPLCPPPTEGRSAMHGRGLEPGAE